MWYVLLISFVISSAQGPETIYIQGEFPNLESCVKASVFFERKYKDLQLDSRCLQQA